MLWRVACASSCKTVARQRWRQQPSARAQRPLAAAASAARAPQTSLPPRAPSLFPPWRSRSTLSPSKRRVSRRHRPGCMCARAAAMRMRQFPALMTALSMLVTPPGAAMRQLVLHALTAESYDDVFCRLGRRYLLARWASERFSKGDIVGRFVSAAAQGRAWPRRTRRGSISFTCLVLVCVDWRLGLQGDVCRAVDTDTAV